MIFINNLVILKIFTNKINNNNLFNIYILQLIIIINYTHTQL